MSASQHIENAPKWFLGDIDLDDGVYVYAQKGMAGQMSGQMEIATSANGQVVVGISTGDNQGNACRFESSAGRKDGKVIAAYNRSHRL